MADKLRYNATRRRFLRDSTLTTIGLIAVTRAALKERQYSAVMAATGLLYLAAFVLMPRAAARPA